ncbi:hypothetical protein ABRP91_05220 [Pectobacterium brasiliense]|uniref:hypothetical protein n=1 Tax=Pectobacterium brasiliense TaxID=180957 RepID=UPI0032ED8AB1
MAEFSTWAKAELKRRRAAKNSERGIDDGIEKGIVFKWLLFIDILGGLYSSGNKPRLFS